MSWSTARLIYLISSLTCSGALSGQLPDSSLLADAHSVVLFDHQTSIVKGTKTLDYKRHRSVLILNEKHKTEAVVQAYIKPDFKIKDAWIRYYRADGGVVKQIKKADFRFQSSSDGSTMVSDGRFFYAGIEPDAYPIRVESYIEYTTSSTLFTPRWNPVGHYHQAILESTYELTSDVPVRFLEHNLEHHNYQKDGSRLILRSMRAIVPESFMPSRQEVFPVVRIALERFSFDGHVGNYKSWQEYGSWIYHDLIKNTRDLPQTTKDLVVAMTADYPTPAEKAARIYRYVQESTRYISIQLGIGGWKPMLATQVDKLKYGDCKALTNYTAALLEEVGIRSLYTEVYGDSDAPLSYQPDFASNEGNHIILCIPDATDTIWLECTSKTNDFGHLGSFTANRRALAITPDGGFIVRTPPVVWMPEHHLIEISPDRNTRWTLTLQGDQAMAQAEIAQYSYELQKRYLTTKYAALLNKVGPKDFALHYDRPTRTYTEVVTAPAQGYSVSGPYLTLALHELTFVHTFTDRDRKRYPAVIYQEEGTIMDYRIAIPEGYQLGKTLDDIRLSHRCGSFERTSYEQDGYLHIRVALQLHAGRYQGDELYELKDLIEAIHAGKALRVVFRKIS